MSKKQKNELNEKEQRQRRRRLIASIGVGVLGAYVAPTLFTVGEAQAQWRHRRSYSRSSYSRYRYSYSYSYSAPSYRVLRRERSRLRDYADDPLLIIEDAIIGSRKD